MCLALFGVLMFLFKRIKTAGVLFGIYLMFNGLERFAIESIRITHEYNVLGFSLTQAQIIAIGLIIFGAVMSIYLYQPKKNPWKTIASKVVYDNPWISTIHNEVLQPDNKPGIYGKVHFKNIAVGIIPLDEDGNTWIVGQYRYVIDQYTWEIPMGGCPIATDPLETARRELIEETGIRSDNFEKILEVYLSNAVSDELGIVYVARDLTFGVAEPDGTEELSIRKLPFEELYQMVLKGEVNDSLSCCGVLKAKTLI